MSLENVELVRVMLAAFNRGDYGAALALLHPEVEWEDPRVIPGGGVHQGHEGVARWFARWLDAWEEFSSEPVEFIDTSGEQVIVIERMRGRGRASGVLVEHTIVSGYDVLGGKVVRRVDYTSKAEALEAAGLSE